MEGTEAKEIKRRLDFKDIVFMWDFHEESDHPVLQTCTNRGWESKD